MLEIDAFCEWRGLNNKLFRRINIDREKNG